MTDAATGIPSRHPHARPSVSGQPSFASRFARAARETWATTTSAIAKRNTAEAMTFASAGIPRDAEMYTYFGKVETDPELKFVMMKSSKLSANDRSAEIGRASCRE